MKEIDELDKKLIKLATDFIHERCDDDDHTVGAALVTGSGNIYLGMNMDGIHSICGEQTAISNAYVAGETDIKRIVSVGLFEGVDTLLSPCGTCRQFMSKYAPEVEIIVETADGIKRCELEEILPFAYVRHVKSNGK